MSDGCRTARRSSTRLPGSFSTGSEMTAARRAVVASVFLWAPSDGETVILGEVRHHTSGIGGGIFHVTEDRATAELWARDLVAGRTPSTTSEERNDAVAVVELSRAGDLDQFAPSRTGAHRPGRSSAPVGNRDKRRFGPVAEPYCAIAPTPSLTRTMLGQRSDRREQPARPASPFQKRDTGPRRARMRQSRRRVGRRVLDQFARFVGAGLLHPLEMLECVADSRDVIGQLPGCTMPLS